jgi:hypothetical protein
LQRTFVLKRATAWLQERRSKQAAIDRALKHFHDTRGDLPMGGHALAHDPQRTIVRVMYMTSHIPPNRTWFAVPADDGEVRELSFDDVAHLEGPWR